MSGPVPAGALGKEHPPTATTAEAFRNQRRDGDGFMAAILTREGTPRV
jgi:hypothetical protein